MPNNKMINIFYARAMSALPPTTDSPTDLSAAKAAVAPKANVTRKPSRLGLRRREVVSIRLRPNLLTCLAETDKWKN